MSLEKALEILEKANQENPLVSTPGVDPSTATPVKTDPEEEPAKKIEEEEGQQAETEEIEEIVEKEEPEKEGPQSARFAMLAKKEKALYRRSQEIKQREEIIDDKLKAIENFEAARKQVKDNPNIALEMLGITYDDITRFQLEGKMPNREKLEIRDLQQEIEDWKAEQKEKEEAAQQELKNRQEEVLQQTIVDFKSEIADYINNNPDEYELISLNDAANLVYSKIENHYTETKRVLTIKEASDEIEKFLEAQVEKNLKAKKLMARVSSTPKAGETKQSPNVQQTRTLNNQMTSSAPSTSTARTEEERFARAMAAMTK